MPLLLGFILGVVLTIAGVYEYDSSTGRAANGLSVTASGGQAPMVNWNVVSGEWQNLQANVRATANDLEQRFKQHS
jgi:hypothetical protein